MISPISNGSGVIVLTDRQAKLQTDTTDNNTTFAARVVITVILHSQTWSEDILLQISNAHRFSRISVGMGVQWGSSCPQPFLDSWDSCKSNGFWTKSEEGLTDWVLREQASLFTHIIYNNSSSGIFSRTSMNEFSCSINFIGYYSSACGASHPTRAPPLDPVGDFHPQPPRQLIQLAPSGGEAHDFPRCCS